MLLELKIINNKNGIIMLSKEEYIKTLDKKIEFINQQYSEPKYKCPKCNGGMCKNLQYYEIIDTMPAIYKDFYKCNTCGFEETISHY